jgi:phosphoglycolate phosphatase-like HAD superfamily hydrolase
MTDGDEIKAVLFDVDGTLVDSVELHARSWQEALARFGVDVELEAVTAQIGKGGDKLIAAFVPAERRAAIEDELSRYRGELFKRDYLPRVRGFPGVRELFLRLQGDGKRLILASSAKDDELAELKRRAGIEDLIDGKVSSDDAERSKPDHDIFQAALAKAGCPVERVVVVGDSPWDAVAARRAGLRSVGVRCGGFPERVLVEAGFGVIHDDPAALLVAYQRHGDHAFLGGWVS